MSAKKTVNQLRGVTITADGVVSAVEVDNTLQALQTAVGGYVERLPLRDGVDMFVNEEGLLLSLPRNELATRLAEGYQVHPQQVAIVGDALVLGEVNTSGDSTDVPDWVYEYLVR
ncbi:MAG: hypothetical protein CVT67_02885 [Actinobacteria bacterium HGW-Actinobacteria-7]|jgi:hypothetical protein|nr:MAG: hypothetical protein CVT67_02885 [Actinobacteria bacterium HGW-Actinobacteria-7]